MKRHNSDVFTVKAHNVVVEPETKAQQQCWESEVIKGNKQQIKIFNILRYILNQLQIKTLNDQSPSSETALLY